MATPKDTPSLTKVIRDAIESRLADVHVSMPAVVESYDETTGLASVTPSLKRTYPNGDVVALPKIDNVPVCFPRAAGGDAYLSMPLTKDDPVTLVFSERSLDIWLEEGGIVDPEDPRKHALSDAYAIPGGYPKGYPVTKGSATDVVLARGDASLTLKQSGDVEIDNGAATITAAASGAVTIAAGETLTLELTADGKVKITGAGGEMIATLVQLFQDVGAAPTMLGPLEANMPTFTEDLAVLQSFKG